MGKSNRRNMNGEETRFKIGNTAAEKWTIENSSEVFEKMYDNACKDSSILCFSDACFSVEMRDSHIDYLIKKFPVLENLKRDIQKRIVSRINKGALEQEYQATAAIWRQKMLGERETTETINTTTNINIDLNEEQKQEALNRVKKGLNEFEDYE